MDLVLLCKFFASKVSGAGKVFMILGLRMMRIRIETVIPRR